ncbi:MULTISPECIES: HAMP domain-containing sensor histidine kinase [Rhodobacterales]|uniref:sensor histidine kinase n=1 Tax=Rhodobacterales TaxID=204455 RepID=UPI0032980D66
MTANALPTGVTSSIEPEMPPTASSDFEDFIYLISHDVRNSVRALIELPQWIVEDLAEAGVKIDGSVADSIDLMNRHTGRLDRMLVDLLAFSRVGRMQAVVEVNLNEALDDVLEEMPVPTGFSVLRDLECDTITMGEQDSLTLLTALISNAIKHHDGNAGTVVVRCKKSGSDAVLSVSDDGPGIPETFHDRIFAAMTTLRPRDEVEGSGMGLAITRKIAQLYGGDARILKNDADGRGSQFEVRLRG